VLRTSWQAKINHKKIFFNILVVNINTNTKLSVYTSLNNKNKKAKSIDYATSTYKTFINNHNNKINNELIRFKQMGKFVTGKIDNVINKFNNLKIVKSEFIK